MEVATVVPVNLNAVPGWVQLLITIVALAVQAGFLINRVQQVEKLADSLKAEVSDLRKGTEMRMNKVEIDQKGLDVSQRALLNSAEQMQQALNRLEDKLDRVLSK